MYVPGIPIFTNYLMLQQVLFALKQQYCTCFGFVLYMTTGLHVIGPRVHCHKKKQNTVTAYISSYTAQNGVVVKISDSSKRPTTPDRQHKRASLARDTVG